jgi:hypothetical protein
MEGNTSHVHVVALDHWKRKKRVFVTRGQFVLNVCIIQSHLTCSPCDDGHPPF